MPLSMQEPVINVKSRFGEGLVGCFPGDVFCVVEFPFVVFSC